MDPQILKKLQVKSTIYTLELVYESPKAWCVMDTCETCDNQIWLPKSQCRLISLDAGLITLEIPNWIASKRKL